MTHWIMTVGGCLLIFTATVLLTTIPNPNGQLIGVFLADLLCGIALLVTGWGE